MSTAAPSPKPTTTTPGSSGYDVSRPHGVCAVTGRAIGPDEKFMAALRETSAGFERLDILMPAWAEFDRKDVVAFWQTVMPRHEQKKKLFVDDQVLCDLFERLGEVTEPAKLNFRFVLGLILMRKRMLMYEDSRNDEGREVWTMRFKGKEQRLDMLNPRLAEEQVAEVSKQLGSILNEEL